MRRLAGVFAVIFLALSLVSCGGSTSLSSSTLLTPRTTPVSLSVQDNPPAGVSILSFEIQITSATLQPSDMTKPTVALLAKPAEVELEHLQSEPALLGSLNVPAGTYSGASVTFSNPRMAILNNSSSPITVGTIVCAVQQVCKLTPTLNNATIAVTAPTTPFPITLASNSPVGLLLHFDVNASVQTDLSITPAIDLKQLAPTAAGVFHKQHLVGTITALAAPNFTLQPGLGAPAIIVTTDKNTEYSFHDELQASCTMNDFSCLAMGQTVRVTADLMADGSLLAVRIALFEQHDQPAFEGTLTSVDATNSQFQMVMMDGQWDASKEPIPDAAVGVPVTVKVTSSTVYAIDLEDMTLPTGLTFNGLGDLVVGQSVEIQPVGITETANPITIIVSTNRVRLQESQVTARVASLNTGATPPTFLLGSLPPLFGSIPGIQVQTLSTTQFDNVSGVSGLTVGDTVSTGGLLFNTATTPTLVAEKVLKR
jgi:hypothetical protein